MWKSHMELTCGYILIYLEHFLSCKTASWKSQVLPFPTSPFFSGSCSQTDGNFTPIEGSQSLEAFSSMWLSQFLNLALGLGVLKSSCSTRLHQQVLHQHQVGSQCLPEAPVICLQPCRRIQWLLSTKEYNLRQPILRFSLLRSCYSTSQ